MGAIWLGDLEQLLRSSNPPGPIQTVGGWQTRSNSHGGYDALRGICIHHDAGGGSDAGSVNFQCFVDADKPNAALHVGRDGTVWIMAAGATNTQGLGGPIIGVPANQGNFQLIGIEQGNNGVGEPYPARQQDAILWLCRTLVARYGTQYGFGADHVISHFEWAPARKNDPAGPSRWAPAGGRWNMNAFRTDVATLLPFPPPIPPPGDDFMTPEDKSYLDAKFAALDASGHLQAVANTVWNTSLGPAWDLGPAPAQNWLMDGRASAGGAQSASNQVLAALEGLDVEALKAAVLAAIDTALADATVDVDTAAIATAVANELAARLAPSA